MDFTHRYSEGIMRLKLFILAVDLRELGMRYLRHICEIDSGTCFGSQ